jgi:hypothetical protein
MSEGYSTGKARVFSTGTEHCSLLCHRILCHRIICSTSFALVW